MFLSMSNGASEQRAPPSHGSHMVGRRYIEMQAEIQRPRKTTMASEGDDDEELYPFMYKVGDDLRQDVLIMQLIIRFTTRAIESESTGSR